MAKIKLGIVGATGAVGREILSILEERHFPVGELRLFASRESAGQSLAFLGKTYPVVELKDSSLDGLHMLFFSAGKKISAEWIPRAAEKGMICIDNSSAFRMAPDVPLIVPEVNLDQLPLHKKRNIIANPNCSTIQLVLILKPLHQKFGLSRVVVSTYQSTSGAGKKAMEELSSQVIALFNSRQFEVKEFQHQIAFNCIPHIDVFQENNYTMEEIKVINESRKILGLPNLRITVTCVRVPTFSCHAESVNIETLKKAPILQVRNLLTEAPGVVVVDNPTKNEYPLNNLAIGRDETFVGRIREDESVANGLNLWIVSDNLRKGAALNVIQIAEHVLKNFS